MSKYLRNFFKGFRFRDMVSSNTYRVRMINLSLQSGKCGSRKYNSNSNRQQQHLICPDFEAEFD